MPLNVLVTRPKNQADELCALIENNGAIPVRFPVLDIISYGSIQEISEKLSRLDQYQWLFFVSTNAVNFALSANDGKIDSFKEIRLCAIGKQTATALRNVGLEVELVPEQNFSSEAVLEMPGLQNLSGQSCLIIRGKGGRELLKESLEQRGAKVDYLEVYQRVMPESNLLPVKKLLSSNQLDVITITSGEALQNFISMLVGNEVQIFSILLVVISERIKQLATKMGFKRVTVAEAPSDAALVKAIFNGEKSGRSLR